MWEGFVPMCRQAAALTAVLTKSKNEQQRQQAKEKLASLTKDILLGFAVPSLEIPRLGKKRGANLEL